MTHSFPPPRWAMGLLNLALISVAQGQGRVDEGGPSEISRTDPLRAEKAIRKTAPALQSLAEARGVSPGATVFLRIFKEERELEAWVEDAGSGQFVLLKTWRVATWGQGTLGPKLRQGDGQAPEGFYYLTPASLNPQSSYHVSMNLGYPNAFDQHHGRTGSALMIHGERVSIGCYAMTNRSIEEIYTLVSKAFASGNRLVRVHIFPFRMTEANLARHPGNPNLSFWRNLQTGYRWFETRNRPPDVNVRSGRYVFEDL